MPHDILGARQNPVYFEMAVRRRLGQRFVLADELHLGAFELQQRWRKRLQVDSGIPHGPVLLQSTAPFPKHSVYIFADGSSVGGGGVHHRSFSKIFEKSRTEFGSESTALSSNFWGAISGVAHF
jgi:hypothetical protein